MIVVHNLSWVVPVSSSCSWRSGLGPSFKIFTFEIKLYSLQEFWVFQDILSSFGLYILVIILEGLSLFSCFASTKFCLYVGKLKRAKLFSVSALVGDFCILPVRGLLEPLGPRLGWMVCAVHRFFFYDTDPFLLSFRSSVFLFAFPFSSWFFECRSVLENGHHAGAPEFVTAV